MEDGRKTLIKGGDMLDQLDFGFLVTTHHSTWKLLYFERCDHYRVLNITLSGSVEFVGSSCVGFIGLAISVES